jgi:hypothetical protein
MVGLRHGEMQAIQWKSDSHTYQNPRYSTKCTAYQLLEEPNVLGVLSSRNLVVVCGGGDFTERLADDFANRPRL